jgi:hypothetical protein
MPNTNIEKNIRWFFSFFPSTDEPWGFIFWCLVIFIIAKLVAHFFTPIAANVMNIEDLSEKMARKDRNIFDSRPQKN